MKRRCPTVFSLRKSPRRETWGWNKDFYTSIECSGNNLRIDPESRSILDVTQPRNSEWYATSVQWVSFPTTLLIYSTTHPSRTVSCHGPWTIHKSLTASRQYDTWSFLQVRFDLGESSVTSLTPRMYRVRVPSSHSRGGPGLWERLWTTCCPSGVRCPVSWKLGQEEGPCFSCPYLGEDVSSSRRCRYVHTPSHWRVRVCGLRTSGETSSAPELTKAHGRLREHWGVVGTTVRPRLAPS